MVVCAGVLAQPKSLSYLTAVSSVLSPVEMRHKVT